MYRTLRVAALVLVAATDAGGDEPGNLECKATHTLECEGVVCRAEGRERTASTCISTSGSEIRENDT
jgi:hypothetical protein